MSYLFQNGECIICDRITRNRIDELEKDMNIVYRHVQSAWGLIIMVEDRRSKVPRGLTSKWFFTKTKSLIKAKQEVAAFLGKTEEYQEQ